MSKLALPHAVLAALLVTGCLSGPAPADQPARIVDPTEEARSELQRVVGQALHVEGVLLAADALTESSVLVVERNRIRSLDNPPLSGRELEAPERFQLVLHGDRCVLVHDGSGRRFDLPATNCVAL